MDLKIPRENANDDFVLITKVCVPNNSIVSNGEVLFEFETSKASIEYEAPRSGFLSEFIITEGSQIEVDAVVGILSENETKSEIKNFVQSIDELSSKEVDEEIFQSKLAQKMLNEGKIPTEKTKWLTSSSFEAVENASIRNSNIGLTNIGEEITNFDTKLNFTTKMITPRKRAEIRSIGARGNYYSSTLGVNIDLGKRIFSNPFFENSILDLVVYEAVKLLGNSFADLNSAFIDEAGGKIVFHEQVIPGIALDNLNNLTVAKLTEINNLPKLSQNIIDVLLRFDESALSKVDLEETTFTVTDLSGAGINFVLPLINGNQCFILGIVKGNGHFSIFGTFDHRITEGKRFSEFLIELADRITSYSSQAHTTIVDKRCHFCDKTLQEEKNLGAKGFLKLDCGEVEQLICGACFAGW